MQEPEITFEDNANPKGKVLFSETGPEFIYGTPEPGVDLIGITVNDPRHGPHTFMFSAHQVDYIIENLSHVRGNVETMRIETLFRGERE